MTVRTYTVPEHKLAAFAERIDTLAKQADAFGVPRPSMEVVALTPKPVLGQPPGAAAAAYMVATVEVTSPTVSGRGYRMVGTIAHDTGSGENVLWIDDRADAERFDLRRFRTALPGCDHCDLDRRRTDTYLVSHNGAPPVQYGRTCMGVVTGLSPAAVDLARMLAAVRATGLDDDSPWPAGSHHYSTALVLSAAAALIRTTGYLPASKAGDGVPSTGRILARALSGLPMVGTPREVLRIVAGDAPSPQDAATARGTQSMAAAIPGDTVNQFEANIRAACSGDTISERNVSLTCAAVVMYQRAAEAEALATMGKVSGHFGAAGDRLTTAKPTKAAREASVTHHAPVLATVASVRVFDGGFYGGTWLVKLLADSGHVFTWRASTEVTAKPGDRVVVSGTVKAHGEYKGTPETVLTRAKLEAA